MPKLSSTLVALVAAAALTATAGCSDLTRPGEILIIAEPPAPAQQVAPRADVEPKPGALKLDGAKDGDATPRRLAVPVEKKAGGGSCGD